MAKSQEQQEEKKLELKVATNTVVGSLFSQLVGVTVVNSEVTLEFVYIDPRTNTQGQVVSRVTLPIAAATSLAEVITSTIKKHDAAK